MMVLPMNGQVEKKPKKPKGKRGRPGHGGQQDVQVNLIVDPTVFQHLDISESEDSKDEDISEEKKKRNHRKRCGLFEGLAMEEQWLAARSWLKKMTMVDVACFVIWGATFVFVLTGERCPSGGFGSW